MINDLDASSGKSERDAVAAGRMKPQLDGGAGTCCQGETEGGCICTQASSRPGVDTRNEQAAAVQSLVSASPNSYIILTRPHIST